MTDSLAQTDYSTTSSDSVGYVAQEISTITMSGGSDYYYSTGSDTITISTGGTTSMGYTIGSNITSIPSMTISSNGNVGIGTISGLTASTFEWKNHEFVDAFPDYDRIQKMCKQYPGLRIAYEKFVTTYKLVKDDYDSSKD
jgi:hypothetical protein